MMVATVNSFILASKFYLKKVSLKKLVFICIREPLTTLISVLFSLIFFYPIEENMIFEIFQNFIRKNSAVNGKWQKLTPAKFERQIFKSFLCKTLFTADEIIPISFDHRNFVLDSVLSVNKFFTSHFLLFLVEAVSINSNQLNSEKKVARNPLQTWSDSWV